MSQKCNYLNMFGVKQVGHPIIYIFYMTAHFSLVVEVVDLLHVAEDDVLLVSDAWRNLLHAAGHLPQVGLKETHREVFMSN